MTDTSHDHSVFGSDLPDTEFAERVLEISSEVGALEIEVVEYLADGPSPEAYLAWAKANFPDLAPAFFKASEKPREGGTAREEAAPEKGSPRQVTDTDSLGVSPSNAPRPTSFKT